MINAKLVSAIRKLVRKYSLQKNELHKKVIERVRGMISVDFM